MSQDDDLIEAAEQQFKTINAAKMRAQAHLAEYRAEGNRDGIAEQLQEIANIDTAAANLSNLYQRYHREQNPPAPPAQSAEEWRVKSAEKMDWNDAYQVAAKSRHGVDMEAFKAGIAEVQRRRARGE
jgi:hypothetical protein